MTGIRVLALALVALALALGAGCAGEDGPGDLQLVAWQIRSDFRPLNDAQRTEIAGVLSRRAALLAGRDVEIRWTDDESGRLTLTGLGDRARDRDLVSHLAATGRWRIVRDLEVRGDGHPTLADAIAAAPGSGAPTSPTWLVAPEPDAPVVLGPMLSRSGLEDLASRLSEDLPDGASPRSLDATLRVLVETRAIGTEGAQVSEWFLASNLQAAPSFGAQRLEATDDQTLSFALTEDDRRRIFGPIRVRPLGPLATSPALMTLVRDETIVSVQAVDLRQPSLLTRLDFPVSEADIRATSALADAGPLPGYVRIGVLGLPSER